MTDSFVKWKTRGHAGAIRTAHLGKREKYIVIFMGGGSIVPGLRDRGNFLRRLSGISGREKEISGISGP